MLRKTDYIQQLVNYIKKNLAKGYTLESLKWALINQGYTRSAVERAIKVANQQLAESAPKMKEKPIIKYEVIKIESPTGISEHKKKIRKKLKSIFKRKRKK